MNVALQVRAAKPLHFFSSASIVSKSASHPLPPNGSSPASVLVLPISDPHVVRPGLDGGLRAMLNQVARIWQCRLGRPDRTHAAVAAGALANASLRVGNIQPSPGTIRGVFPTAKGGVKSRLDFNFAGTGGITNALVLWASMRRICIGNSSQGEHCQRSLELHI